MSDFRGREPESSQRNSTSLSRVAVTTDEIHAHMGESNTKKVCKLSLSCFNIVMVINSKTDMNLGQT